MVIIADDRLPVLNSIQDLDDIRGGGVRVERKLSSPAPSPRHVILNLIQDPLARADAQEGSFCGVQQSLIEQAVEESNFPPTKYQRQSYVQGLALAKGEKPDTSPEGD